MGCLDYMSGYFFTGESVEMGISFVRIGLASFIRDHHQIIKSVDVGLRQEENMWSEAYILFYQKIVKGAETEEED